MSPRRNRFPLLPLCTLGLLVVTLHGCVEDPEFTTVPSGSFTLGSPSDELGRGPDETLHPVRLTRDFEIMTTEVTQGQFERLMRYNPSVFPAFGADPTRPVESVNWFDALAFANRLSGEEGYPPCFHLSEIECTDGTAGDTVYHCMHHGGIHDARVALNEADCVYDCPGYRLPTEAEWEAAARAGAATALPNGDVTQTGCSPLDPNLDAVAWYCGNAEMTTHPVGGKLANAWGLHDMSGNVREWCWDRYAAEIPDAVTDPVGAPDGRFRVVRGGGVRHDGASRCRLAHRAAHSPGFHSRYVGFRLVRTLSTEGRQEGCATVDRGTSATTRPKPAHLSPVAAPDLPGSLPDSLPFPFERDDAGEPLTPEEITAFTRKITGFWRDVDYFRWALRHSHGMAETNPYGMPDYKLYWQDTQAIKDGHVVTFEHRGGADNLEIRTSKVLNNALAGYLMSGDPVMGKLAEQYAKGIVALFEGMLWDAEDPEPFITARAMFTQDHAYVEDGRQARVVYGPAKKPKEDWNAHTLPNPDNPLWGDMWVRNMRSKDDVPHLYRTVPPLMDAAFRAPDPSVREAAARAVAYLQGFAQDIVDSGYHIRTKDGEGNAYVPLMEGGGINDLASFVKYVGLVPDAECNPRVASALIGYGNPLDVDCGNGIGALYEFVATHQHYFNYAIIRTFHVAAITNALVVGEDDVAYELLRGLAERVDALVAGEGNWEDYRDWDSDVASYLLMSATAGLPLTSLETRRIVEQYSMAVDHYAAWPNWDLWDPAVPDGDVDYKPSRNGTVGGEPCTFVRPTELTYLIEYCYSPFRNETGAPLVDCDVVADPARWGE